MTPETLNVGAFLDRLETFFTAQQLPKDAANKVLLAFDEILSNVAAYSEACNEISIRVWADNDQIGVEVEDDGMAFDPFQLAAPDVGASLDNRAPGGLGVHLVRCLMDDVVYERRNQRNCLRFVKNLQT